MIERRIHQRSASIADIKFQTGAVSSEIKKQVKSIKGEGVNVSEGGVCLRVTKPVRKDQVIKVIFPVNDIPVEIPTLAMVRWVKPHKKKYMVGIMFIV
jgi:hypothetical protein